MIYIPKFPNITKKINGEYNKFAAAFSDTWFVVIVAHLLGIGLGVILSIAAARSQL